MSSNRPTEFADEQITLAIACAIGEHKFQIVADLMHVLAAQNPQAAQDLLDAINLSGALVVEPSSLTETERSGVL